jgi:hypothetical protein
MNNHACYVKWDTPFGQALPSLTKALEIPMVGKHEPGVTSGWKQGLVMDRGEPCSLYWLDLSIFQQTGVSIKSSLKPYPPLVPIFLSNLEIYRYNWHIIIIIHIYGVQCDILIKIYGVKRPLRLSDQGRWLSIISVCGSVICSKLLWMNHASSSFE